MTETLNIKDLNDEAYLIIGSFENNTRNNTLKGILTDKRLLDGPVDCRISEEYDSESQVYDPDSDTMAMKGQGMSIKVARHLIEISGEDIFNALVPTDLSNIYYCELSLGTISHADPIINNIKENALTFSEIGKVVKKAKKTKAKAKDGKLYMNLAPGITKATDINKPEFEISDETQVIIHGWHTGKKRAKETLETINNVLKEIKFEHRIYLVSYHDIARKMHETNDIHKELGISKDDVIICLYYSPSNNRNSDYKQTSVLGYHWNGTGNGWWKPADGNIPMLSDVVVEGEIGCISPEKRIACIYSDINIASYFNIYKSEAERDKDKEPDEKVKDKYRNDYFKKLINLCIKSVNITPEEIADINRRIIEATKAKYVEMLTKAQKGKKKTLEASIKNQMQSVTEYREKLLSHIVKLDNTQKELHMYMYGHGDKEKILLRDYDTIVKHAFVEKATTVDTQIHVHTKTLTVVDTRTNKNHYLGKFIIKIEMKTSDRTTSRIKFENITQKIHGSESGMHAPHVFPDGNACLGEIESEVADIIATGEISNLVYLLIEYLRSANVKDSAGSYIHRWPIAKADGTLDEEETKKMKSKKLASCRMSCSDCSEKTTCEISYDTRKSEEAEGEV